jgi:hypothetical protein
MSIPNAGIIALIILACLSAVAIAAALFGHLSLPSRPVFGFSDDQQKYMRSVRLKRLRALQQDNRFRGTPSRPSIHPLYINTLVHMSM